MSELFTIDSPAFLFSILHPMKSEFSFSTTSFTFILIPPPPTPKLLRFVETHCLLWRRSKNFSREIFGKPAILCSSTPRECLIALCDLEVRFSWPAVKKEVECRDALYWNIWIGKCEKEATHGNTLSWNSHKSRFQSFLQRVQIALSVTIHLRRIRCFLLFSD